ncbi:MAG: hypothetical protein D6791_13195 [Chloroflexi bacterium]|nr:MAG: hypothetical protein D6791_13195 [Chloroflexota bacterium]
MSPRSKAKRSAAEAVVAGPTLPDLSDHPLLTRLTVEHLAYALLIIAPLTIRLINLGARPLAPAEAETALRAWQASRGLETSLDAGIPLLFSLQWLTFFLAGGAGEALARVWPVLASAAIPLVVYDWRRRLGKTTALLTALLLTASPLLNAFGRRGDGPALTLLALSLALSGWGRVREGQDRGWVPLAAGVGLLLISGPAAPTALLGLALFALLEQRLSPRVLSAPTLGHGLVGLAVVLVGGSAFLTRPAGIGLLAVNWSEWLGAFSLSGRSLLWGFLRLPLDEPLLVSAGLVAIVRSFRRNDTLAAFSLTAAALLVVSLLQGPYASGSRLVLVLFLGPPVARFLVDMGRSAVYREANGEAWLYVVVLGMLLALGVFSLIAYSRSGDVSHLYLLVATVLMSLVLTAVFGFFIGWQRLVHMLALVLFIALGLFDIAMLWGMGYDTNSPRFPALYASDTRPGIVDLQATINDLSERRKGDPWSLPVAIMEQGPASDLLQWQLRRVTDLSMVTGVSLETAPPLVVAPIEAVLPLSDRYAGQDFAILDAWEPGDADIRRVIAWALYRIAPWDLPTENYVLWADSTILTPQ